jgi:hypothetical protein
MVEPKGADAGMGVNPWGFEQGLSHGFRFDSRVRHKRARRPVSACTAQRLLIYVVLSTMSLPSAPALGSHVADDA